MNSFLFSCLRGLWIAIVLICLSCPVVVQAKDSFRFSRDSEKVRIVLDVSKDTKYLDKTAANNQILVEIKTNSSLDSEVQALDDDLVKQISLKSSGNTKSLTVDLKQTSKYKIFALSTPERVVIDVFRDSSIANINFPKGVEYKTWTDYSSGQPVVVYLLKVAPGNKEYKVLPLLAQGRIYGRATTQQTVMDSFAGINASYFDGWGSIYGNTKIAGQIVSAEDKFRTGFAMDPKNGYDIFQANYQGTLVLPGNKRLGITGVNRKALYTDLVIYNDSYDTTTRTDNTGVEVVVTGGKVQAVNHNTGNTTIPKDGYVIAAFGYNIYEVANLNVGDPIKLEQSLGQADAYQTFIGAGPCLVRDGKVEVTSVEEEFPRDISVGRAPRSAIGITKNQELLFVVVDGRSSRSAGFTLEQLAECLVSLGAEKAMNFDGGGSSTFVLNGFVRNKPSDGTQRPIALALGLKKVK